MVTLLVLSSYKLLVYCTPSKFSWHYITNRAGQIIGGLWSSWSQNVEEASVFDCADRLKITHAYISSRLSEWVGGVVRHQPDVTYVFVGIWTCHCITDELRLPREGIFSEISSKINPQEKHVGRQRRSASTDEKATRRATQTGKTDLRLQKARKHTRRSLWYHCVLQALMASEMYPPVQLLLLSRCIRQTVWGLAVKLKITTALYLYIGVHKAPPPRIFGSQWNSSMFVS